MRKNNFLLCYDICDKKRLQRVHRFVSEHFMQLQYSVYFAEMYSPQMDKIIIQLQKMIDQSEDDVRVYIVEDLQDGFVLNHQSSDILLFDEHGVDLNSFFIK